MSMPMDIKRVCAVCGRESRQTVLASASMFGSPDLDLRPPRMKRDTMLWWVQECPLCGYVSSDIAAKSCVTVEWLKSSDYKSCSGIPFLELLAKRFYRHYLISKKDNNTRSAFYAALYAAWVCDDAYDEDNARKCRLLALGEVDELLSAAYDENLAMMRADILRRAGEFDAVVSDYEGKVFSSDLFNRIIAHQISRARERDASCYKVSDVAH